MFHRGGGLCHSFLLYNGIYKYKGGHSKRQQMIFFWTYVLGAQDFYVDMSIYCFLFHSCWQVFSIVLITVII